MQCVQQGHVSRMQKMNAGKHLTNCLWNGAGFRGNLHSSSFLQLQHLILSSYTWSAAIQRDFSSLCRPKVGGGKKKKKGKEGGRRTREKKLKSNILCWYSFAALQTNFSVFRLKTDYSLPSTLSRAETKKLRAGKITLHSQGIFPGMENRDIFIYFF